MNTYSVIITLATIDVSSSMDSFIQQSKANLDIVVGYAQGFIFVAACIALITFLLKR